MIIIDESFPFEPPEFFCYVGPTPVTLTVDFTHDNNRSILWTAFTQPMGVKGLPKKFHRYIKRKPKPHTNPFLNKIQQIYRKWQD